MPRVAGSCASHPQFLRVQLRMSALQPQPPNSPLPPRPALLPARLLTRSQIGGLLSIAECIPAMRDAFAAHHLGHSLRPELLHVNAPGGEFHIKAGGLRIAHDAPQAGSAQVTASHASATHTSATHTSATHTSAAHAGGEHARTYFALKANGGFFGNAAKGLPSIRGLILLFDASNGDVLAVMDSRDITAVRTAATTALAIDLLASPDAATATMCGCGGQSLRHLLALRHVRPSIKTIHVWSRTPARAEAFCVEHASAFNSTLRPVTSLDECAPASDIIITCTPARSPFLAPSHVRPGACVAAIGADSPEKQELHAELTARSRLVVDLLEQCARVGELHHAIDARLMTTSDVHATLGELASGAKPAGWKPDTITVFDSTGTALQDTAAAALVYHRAVSQSIGTILNFQG
jgi:alanine dehydrogenase